MKESIKTNIDFSDATYISCNAENGNLTVYLNSWDDKKIKIEFTNAIQFIYKNGGFVSGLFETKNSTYLQNSLSFYYEKIPQNQPFKSFVISDIDDFPLFEVIAEKVIVTKI